MAQNGFNPEKIVKRYIEELRKVNIHPEQIILYGSYANGTQDKWSDIDLVVVSHDFDAIHPLKRLEMLSLATLKLGAPIEALGYSPKEIRERGAESIMWEAIQKNHRVIYKAA